MELALRQRSSRRKILEAERPQGSVIPSARRGATGTPIARDDMGGLVGYVTDQS